MGIRYGPNGVTETLLAPTISALLYLFIFGFSLGNRFGSFHGYTYLQFLVPGLVMMGLVTKDPQLFKKIGEEIERRKRGGDSEMKAAMEVMKKYREELAHLMQK